MSFFSSSLKQIDATTVRLERRLSEIGAIVIKFGAGDAEKTPAISATGDSPSGMTFISSIFIKNAEIGNRRWASIGVDEWIQAGKWWLMKVGFHCSDPVSILLTDFFGSSLKWNSPADPHPTSLVSSKDTLISSRLPGF